MLITNTPNPAGTFLAGISDIEQVHVNGSLEHGVPHILNVSFAFVEGESLIMSLKDLAVSSGSACTSASLEPSYVLRAWAFPMSWPIAPCALVLAAALRLSR